MRFLESGKRVRAESGSERKVGQSDLLLYSMLKK